MGKTIVAISVLSVLAGCSGGGGSGGANGGSTAGVGMTCDSIAGGDSTLSTSAGTGCNNCSISNNNNAVDGDLSTYAAVTIGQSGPAGGPSLTATAQSGVVFPAGSKPGAFVTVPAAAESYTVQITTYLSGVQQDSYTTPSANGGATDEQMYFDLNGAATTTFDSVKVSFTDVQTTIGDRVTFGLSEICSDGALTK